MGYPHRRAQRVRCARGVGQTARTHNPKTIFDITINLPGFTKNPNLADQKPERERLRRHKAHRLSQDILELSQEIRGLSQDIFELSQEIHELSQGTSNYDGLPNGERYLPWGGAQIRCLNGTIHYEVYSHFSGANPHGQVNAVLGRLLTYQDLAN